MEGREPPQGGGPWFPEFQLPELDMLVSCSPPPALDPDAVAQWLGTSAEFGTAATTGAPLQLTSSGGGSSGTNTTTSLSKEEEKQEKARAANRAKQTRFRQRQKERKVQLAAQYEVTAADLEREQQLNASMKVSCATLEAVKEQKDVAVQVLQAAGADGPTQGQQQQQMQVQLSGTASELSSGILAEQLWAMPFRQRVDVCCRIFCQTEPVHKALHDHIGEGVCKPDGFALHITVRKQLAQQMAAHHPNLLTAALAISPEVLVKEWAELGELSAEVVQRYDDGELTEQGVNEALCDPVMYFAILGGILMNHRPHVLQHLLNSSKVAGETEEQAAARWRDVALCMGVSPEQQGKRMLSLFQTYCDRMQQLGADTAVALESLRDVQQHLSEQMVISGLSSSVQQYLRVFEAAGQLSHQSNAALLITLDFMSTAGNAVTPLQKARMNARCRPLHPDVVSIVREWLDHHGLLPKARDAAAQPNRPPVAAAAAPGPQSQQQQC